MLVPVKLPCAGCGTMVEIALPDKPRLTNLTCVSLAVFEHSQQTICPGCLTPVIPTLVGLSDAMFALTPLTPAKRIVTPGG